MATVVDVAMPQMGVSVSEGTLVAWHKQVGDRVERDETLCEVSTDKVDTDCPAPASGELAELLVDVGQTVEVGTVIARIAVEAGNGSEATAAVEQPAAAPPPRAPAAAAQTAALPEHAPPRGAGPRSSPVARRIAAANGIDLERIEGTGRDGRITKRDVLAAVEADGAEPPLHSESPYRPEPPPAPDDLGGVPQPLSRMRQSIGAAMLRSQATAATAHTVVECDMSRVDQRRRELRLTALPLVARAAIDTLTDFPDLNATLEDTTLTRYERVHLGIAVSLGEDGLIVPVIHDAQDLSPEGLGRRIKELAGRARAKELTPDDVRGATFTITNPGAFGALIATPIINVPQVAILDLEAIARRPVVITDAEGNEGIAIRSMANLCLGWDHRAVDGAYAAQFLTALRLRLERA